MERAESVFETAEGLRKGGEGGTTVRVMGGVWISGTRSVTMVIYWERAVISVSEENNIGTRGHLYRRDRPSVRVGLRGATVSMQG